MVLNPNPSPLTPAPSHRIHFPAMKRLGRWLFNPAAGVSLVLFLAMPVIWVRSHFAMNSIGWVGQKRSQALVTSIGATALFVTEMDTRAEYGLHVRSSEPSDFLGSFGTLFAFQKRLGGFAVAHTGDATTPYGTTVVLQVPCWFLTILFAILPAIRLRTFLLERRVNLRGLCPVCGYDLRVQLALSEQRRSDGQATPTRCPECGTATSMCE